MSTNFIDLTGKKFGKWTVLKRGPNTKGGWVRWTCKCECGVIKNVSRCSLRNGRSQGCQNCSKKNRIHGQSRTQTYRIWASIIERCYDEKHPHFLDYGGRNILMCDEWRKNYLNFLRDMGKKPKGLTLDRIDNDKGYYKENCRWVSMTVQNRNRRNSIRVGFIIRNWKVIERLENRNHTIFQCVNCKKTRRFGTYYLQHHFPKCFCP